MTYLSIGKRRGLQQCSTNKKVFSVLALDHRNNLRNAMNPSAPQTVTDQDMLEFKIDLVHSVSPKSSCVLLDPQFSASQCVASDALPGQVGMICAVEATGYDGDPAARISQVLEGWSVAKIKRLGATGVKLLVYYHPQSETAKMIENFVKVVADDCAAADIPLFLEPLSYPLDPKQKKVTGKEREDVVLETARKLVIPGVDVLKAEFPIDIQAFPDEREWERACAALSSASPAPWILLSASVPYPVFLKQVQAACVNGASGVAVGRAVWQEAPTLTGQDRLDFLNIIAAERMERTTHLVNALAKPWTDFYQTDIPNADWYKNYPES